MPYLVQTDNITKANKLQSFSAMSEKNVFKFEDLKYKMCIVIKMQVCLLVIEAQYT